MGNTNTYKMVLRWLKKFKVRYRWIDKYTYGISYRKSNRAVINVSLFLVSTYIHECYHLEYPKMSEGDVIQRTNVAIQFMKNREIRKIARMLVVTL